MSTRPNESSQPAASTCASCNVYRAARLKKLGVDMANWDHLVALVDYVGFESVVLQIDAEKIGDLGLVFYDKCRLFIHASPLGKTIVSLSPPISAWDASMLPL